MTKKIQGMAADWIDENDPFIDWSLDSIAIKAYTAGYEKGKCLNKEKIMTCLNYLNKYGGIDGDHHKQWLINKLVLILTDDYDSWVKDFQSGQDGPDTYLWSAGIAP